MDNGSDGFTLYDKSNLTIQNLLSTNNSTGIVFPGASSVATINQLGQIVVANNISFDLDFGLPLYHVFTDNLLLSSGGSCSSSLSNATTPGLSLVDCSNEGASDANLLFVDLSNSFVGKVTSDDVANPDDTNGVKDYDSITDWSNFENSFRAWGKDHLDSWPSSNHLGRCVSPDNCQIWDYRLSGADIVLRNTTSNGSSANDTFVNAANCIVLLDGNMVLADNLNRIYNTPSLHNAREVIGDSTGNEDGVCEAFEPCQNVFLKHAVEIFGDTLGDDDGLCESNEACIYSPNFGAYQGEGDYTSLSCTFQDGIVSGVTMYAYPINGG